jgi:hypothetical protein
LVDDESDIAFIFEQILEHEGFEVNSLNDFQNGFLISGLILTILHLSISGCLGWMDWFVWKIKMTMTTSSTALWLPMKYIIKNWKDYPELNVGFFIKKPTSTIQLVKEIKSKLNPLACEITIPTNLYF